MLSALGVVVNKGNLGALQDITDEAYQAVVGRTQNFNGLLPRLAELTRSLNRQTDDIIAAAEGLNRVAGQLAGHRDDLARALDTLPDAIKVLNNNRDNIVNAFAALGRFSEVGSRMLSQTKTDLTAVIRDLYPVVKAFNDSRDEFISDLKLLPTFPFVNDYIKNAVRGDYLNVFVTFDLTVRRTGESVFTTSALDPNMKHMGEVLTPPDWLTGQLANLSGQAADPFKIPPGTARQ